MRADQGIVAGIMRRMSRLSDLYSDSWLAQVPSSLSPPVRKLDISRGSAKVSQLEYTLSYVGIIMTDD